MGFTSFLVTQYFNLKYLFNISLKTIRFEISTDCKMITACPCPRLHNCCDEWEGWDPVYWLNHAGRVAIVTPTSYVGPQALCNRFFLWRFCVFTLLYGFSVCVGAFVIGLSHISSFFCLTCPSKHRHGATLFIRLFWETAPFTDLVAFYDTLGIRRTHSRLNPHGDTCVCRETHFFNCLCKRV